MNEDELQVKKIESGTVIDHISAGKALAVLRILGITGAEDFTVSVLMNARSKKYGKKDLVKIEKRRLTTTEVNKIALISPHATINIIENYKVIEKFNVKLPEEIIDVVKCANPTCITNSKEPVTPKFKVVEVDPIKLRCIYCNRFTTVDDIIKQFSGEEQ